ncbi:hypothetical protein [Thermomonospora amylolytica]|uniref:hypothetical protein n=1 Tax=Thermomonospora amylolytica TaxID=1411117 RepID=UPI0013008CE0|nr:hypothetical protein [Thermomonospora amylolytica]
MEWGKRQAARSPRWSDAKWQQVATIFGVVLDPIQDDEQNDGQGQADEQQAEASGRDAA